MQLKTSDLTKKVPPHPGCLGLPGVASLWRRLVREIVRPGQHVQEVLHDQDPPGQLGQAGGAVQLAADGQHEEGRERFAVGRLSHAQGTCI